MAVDLPVTHMMYGAKRPVHAVGDCLYCCLALYSDGPVVAFPDGRVAHVACEIDARRQGRGVS